MIYHLPKLFIGKATIHPYGVPVLFVHVVTGLYFVISFTQIGSQLGVALYVEAVSGIKTNKQEEFFAYLKYQGIFTKWEALGNTGQGNAMFS